MKEWISVQKEYEVQSLISNIAFADVPSWYGSTRRNLHMDILAPKVREGHKACPCIVWICGGAYMVVDHSVWIPEMVYFARAGYVVASVEYRTSNECQFPTPLEDVKSAIRYLKAHAAEYAIDPDRIFVIGESAGGTLASLVGTTGHLRKFDKGDYLDQNSAVRGVVDFYGGSNLMIEGSVTTGDAVPPWTMEAFLGGGADSGQAARASAVNYVTAETPPFMIFHGEDDPLVPVLQSDLMYEALVKHNVPVEYLIIQGAVHGDDLFYQDAVKARILQFLNGLL